MKFTPAYPGIRLGAVEFFDGSGNSLGYLFEDDPNDDAGFADQFHVAFQQQNRTLMAQLERVGVALIDLSIQDWYGRNSKT